mgnify:CR=1 FL=1
MRNRKLLTLVAAVFVCALASVGCRTATIAGFNDGVETGLSNTIVAIFNEAWTQHVANEAE